MHVLVYKLLLLQDTLRKRTLLSGFQKHGKGPSSSRSDGELSLRRLILGQRTQIKQTLLGHPPRATQCLAMHVSTKCFFNWPVFTTPAAGLHPERFLNFTQTSCHLNSTNDNSQLTAPWAFTRTSNNWTHWRVSKLLGFEIHAWLFDNIDSPQTS